MYWDHFCDVYFVEGVPSGARLIAPISSSSDGFFTEAQLKTLILCHK